MRGHHVSVLGIALSLAMLAPGAGAQMSALPPDVAAGVARIGRKIDPPGTAKLFAPLQEREPYAGVTVTRDVKYGPADRHRLDIFTPETGAAPRPVLVFVHGGAFVGGNKRLGESPFHDNIALWAARNGLVGVIMTYRLAPANRWPAGAEDVATAVRWIAAHAAEHGGDPGRAFLMGHSAGAVHVADYVARPAIHGEGEARIAGAILLSGLFDLTGMTPAPPPVKAYYGDDVATYAERSTSAGLSATPVPLMVVWGELDPPEFVQQAGHLRDALCQKGRCPWALMLPGHSHMSEVYAINTKDTQLTGAVLEFVRSGR
jgi:triacylglycerol lipase